MIRKSHFKPAWWLPGPHLQTMWATSTRQPPEIKLARQRIELPDGDFIGCSGVTEHERAAKEPRDNHTEEEYLPVFGAHIKINQYRKNHASCENAEE